LGNGHLPDIRSRRGFRFHYGKHGFRHSIPKLEQVSECKTLYFNKFIFILCRSVTSPSAPQFA
jgi:hypothetical protein